MSQLGASRISSLFQAVRFGMSLHMGRDSHFASSPDIWGMQWSLTGEGLDRLYAGLRCFAGQGPGTGKVNKPFLMPAAGSVPQSMVDVGIVPGSAADSTPLPGESN